MNTIPLRRLVVASALAVAASGAVTTAAFAGDIVAVPDCEAFDPDNYDYDHEVNGHEVTVLLSYEDDVNTCDVVVTVNTWTLPFHNALEWEPGAAVFATELVSLNAVEAATKQGAPLGVTLATPECHTQTEVILGTTDMGGYKWSYECEIDDKVTPQDEPDPDPDPDLPEQQPEPEDPDGPGDGPQDEQLPETGASTGSLVAVAAALSGLGLASVLAARRRHTFPMR